MKKINHLESAKRTIEIEASALNNLSLNLSKEFNLLCDDLLKTKGRIVTLGIGKSGHIANKIAATLSSTGSASIFINAAEALHGDIGSIKKEDKVIIFSNSGQTEEIIDLLPTLLDIGCDFYSITGNRESKIAISAKLNIDTCAPEEACPLGLAPTTSTTSSLALGDAIAIALLEARGFNSNDFAKSHPGGKLGKRLLLKVSNLMHTGKDFPCVRSDSKLSETLLEVSSKGLGIAVVIDSSNKMKGVFTDGDLRRALNKKIDIHATRISQLMSKKAKTIKEDELAINALDIMQSNAIYSLVVFDSKNYPIGIIRMHDLIESGLI
jgi:arabinose-5-phosphate isomerase|tara:strand:- start:5877 stop:6848 length:972 start_codon:yes stop_codon:yes gene_type:complete